MLRFRLFNGLAGIVWIGLIASGCHSDSNSSVPPFSETPNSEAPATFDSASRQPAIPADRPSPSADRSPTTHRPDTDRRRNALFDGETLTGWKKTEFGGEGAVEVRDGAIQLAMGYPLTGITSDLETLPTLDYELQLQAQRVDGNDFFCGLTFPVGDSHATLIVGGWGGTLVGISSLDDQDAARNETARHMNFDNGHWYTIRVRVEPDRIQAWIDDERVVDVNTTNRKISVRNEVILSRPLGICSFQTSAALRQIEWWPLEPSVQTEPSRPTAPVPSSKENDGSHL